MAWTVDMQKNHLILTVIEFALIFIFFVVVIFHLTIAHILRQFVLSQFFSRLNRSDHKTERLHAVNLTFKVMEYCIMMQP